MKKNLKHFDKKGRIIKSKGFTLIELMVVLSIIAILSAVIFTSLNKARDKAKDSQISQAIIQMRNQFELYALDHGGSYPDVAFNSNKHFAETDSSNSWLSIFGIKTAFAAVNGDCVRDMDFGDSVWTPKLRKIDNIPDDAEHHYCLRYFKDAVSGTAAVWGNLSVDAESSGGSTYTRKIGAVFGAQTVEELRLFCEATKTGLLTGAYPSFSVHNGNSDCSGSVPFDRVFGMTSGGALSVTVTQTDADADGYYSEVNDCNDADNTIHPGAPDNTLDGIDNDCDGQRDEDYNASCQGSPMISCSGQGQGTCQGPGYNLMCTWTDGTSEACNGTYQAGQDCAPFTDPTSCGSNSCNWATASCSDFNGNQSTCEGTTNCSWDENSSYYCSGTYTPTSGNYCSGTYYTTESCSGIGMYQCQYSTPSGCSYQPNVDGTCNSNGVSSCSSFTGQTDCNSVSGCSWQ